MPAVGLYALFNLGGEFPRWGEDEGADVRARQRFCGQQLQNRQREAGRFAGAGLGANECVLAVKDDRDGLCLDRGGLGVAGIGNSAYELGTQAERFK